MHISEGFLSPQTLAAGAAITAAGVAWGLKKTDPDRIVRVAMASSVFFLASLIKIPVGPTSTHLSLIGPIGILLGWSAYPAIFVALLMQAVLFQFGGLLVLGANAASMGTAAVLAHILFGRAVRGGNGMIAAIASFAAGFTAVIFGVGFVGTWLTISDPGFSAVSRAFFVSHVPLAFVEGIATCWMTAFLRRTFPDVLGMSR